MRFIGRTMELKRIRAALTMPRGTVLLYGKRRVGKTTLIKEAIKPIDAVKILYTCMPIELSRNAEDLSAKAMEALGFPAMRFSTFPALFDFLKTRRERIIVILDEYQDLADLIYDGNDLGYVLQEQGQGEPHFLEKFRAALEYEQCHELKLALDIASNLNCYDYCPASDVERFGEEVLQKQGETVFRDPVLQRGIDLKTYGEAQLEQQGYLLNTAETGYIRSNVQEFCHERTEPQPEFGMTM